MWKMPSTSMVIHYNYTHLILSLKHLPNSASNEGDQDGTMKSPSRQRGRGYVEGTRLCVGLQTFTTHTVLFCSSITPHLDKQILPPAPQAKLLTGKPETRRSKSTSIPHSMCSRPRQTGKCVRRDKYGVCAHGSLPGWTGRVTEGTRVSVFPEVTGALFTFPCENTVIFKLRKKKQ